MACAYSQDAVVRGGMSPRAGAARFGVSKSSAHRCRPQRSGSRWRADGRVRGLSGMCVSRSAEKRRRRTAGSCSRRSQPLKTGEPTEECK